MLGEAGAGKTVLALRLLLDLAQEALTALDSDPTARVRVPIRLSLPSFTTPEGTIGATDLRARLDDWIAAQLNEVHSIPPAIAAALVRGGKVLPVLDGLDEMDHDGDEPLRARQIITALNQPSGATPGSIVLTCRTAHYEQVTRSEPLQDATAVLIQPLGVEQVISWLAHRFPDATQQDRLHHRWRRVATNLRKHPTGRLAGCLRSPLRLYLATAIYSSPGSTPAELCDLSAAALEEHLFARLIPALTKHHPRSDGTSYAAEDVERWLRTLADHLARMAALGRSGTDLYLHLLWLTVGDPPGRRIRYQATALLVGAVAAPLIAYGIYYAYQTGTYIPAKPREKVGAGTMLLMGVMVALVQNTLDASEPPQRLDLRSVRTSRGRRRLAGSLVGAIVFSLVIGVMSGYMTQFVPGLPFGPEDGLALGLMGGLAFGLAFGLEALTLEAAHPSAPVRQTLTWSVAYGIAITLAFGFSIGPVGGAVLGFSSAVALGISFGLQGSPLPRYAVAVHRLHRAGDLPRRPGQFLDWAYQAGLVRMAGSATQFRHRDLQANLTTSV